MKRTVALAALLLASGFAFAAPPETETATIHLYRNKAAVAWLWKYKIKINGKKVKVRTNSCNNIKVPAGSTRFYVTGLGHNNMTMNLEAGKDYYVKSFLRAGLFANKVEVVPVPEDFAKNQMAKMKQKRTKDVTL